MGKSAPGGQKRSASGGRHARGGGEKREWQGNNASTSERGFARQRCGGDERCAMSRDRGYGTGPWLWHLSVSQIRFVVRWKKGNKLRDAAEQERKAWEIAAPANAPGERPDCCGIRISASIGARGCSLCPFATPSIEGTSGWSSYDKARDVSRGIYSLMNRWKRKSKRGTCSSPTLDAGKSRSSSASIKRSCSSNPCDSKAGNRVANCSCW